MKELTNNIRYEFRTPAGMHKEYLDNLVYTFGVHWIAQHREAHGWDCDTVEICKQDSRGGCYQCHCMKDLGTLTKNFAAILRRS